MTRQWLSVLAWILFAASLVWWWLENDHRDHWLLLMVLSFAVLALKDWLARERSPKT